MLCICLFALQNDTVFVFCEARRVKGGKMDLFSFDDTDDFNGFFFDEHKSGENKKRTTE